MTYLLSILISFSVFGDIKDNIKINCEINNETRKDCKYTIDKIKIEVVGVGENLGSILFHSTKSKKYWVKYNIGPKCIMISHKDKFGLAFISPRNGKIYKNVSSCELN